MRTTNAMQLKARVNSRAKEAGIPAQMMMQNYLLERLLERLSRSPWRDRVVVKGGMLISSLVGVASRTTKESAPSGAHGDSSRVGVSAYRGTLQQRCVERRNGIGMIAGKSCLTPDSFHIPPFGGTNPGLDTVVAPPCGCPGAVCPGRPETGRAETVCNPGFVPRIRRFWNESGVGHGFPS